MSSTHGKDKALGLGAMSAMAAAAVSIHSSSLKDPSHISDLNPLPIPKEADVPRRLSTDRKSPHYDPIYKRIGVTIDGRTRDDVHEYDLDERWADVRLRRPDGRYRLDERGKYVLARMTGEIHVYFTKLAPSPVASTYIPTPPDHEAHKQAAADKQARKAAKRAALVNRNNAS